MSALTSWLTYMFNVALKFGMIFAGMVASIGISCCLMVGVWAFGARMRRDRRSDHSEKQTAGDSSISSKDAVWDATLGFLLCFACMRYVVSGYMARQDGSTVAGAVSTGVSMVVATSLGVTGSIIVVIYLARLADPMFS